ncbi:MAG: Fic/DOC family N-terminal domain-containing protein [Halofilum sp. (in: g-proteobacteria)]
MGEANAALARYDGLLQGLVNPSVLLSPLTSQEAVLSSRIEGTQATMEEVLEHEAGRPHEPGKAGDIEEVLNYRRALRLGSEEIRERPIRQATVRALHRELMTGVRGQEQTPGEFRKDQNWIGPEGCAIEEATFVPPSPLHLRDGLEAWERYLGSPDIDPIIQAAIAHAQFELLHPFRDGNGRVGRLLIPLFLTQAGRLSQPMFYLSAYLERHRDRYYAGLQALSRDNAWTDWVRFFLTAVIEQARENVTRVEQIQALYEQIKAQVRDTTHSQHSAQLVDALFARPIFRVADVEANGIPRPTAHTLLRQLESIGTIRVMQPAAGRRAAIFAFPALLNVVEGREVIPE